MLRKVTVSNLSAKEIREKKKRYYPSMTDLTQAKLNAFVGDIHF